MIVNPGIRRFLGSAIQRLFNSASFYAPLTHSLVLERGTGSPTFTRATTSTWPNNDGYMVTGVAGEIGFVGARRVRNLLQGVVGSSEDITSSGWLVTNAPTRTATTFATTITTQQLYVPIGSAAPTVGDKFLVQVVLSGTPGNKINLYAMNGAASSGAGVQVTLTATPTVYSIVGTVSVSAQHYIFLTSGSFLTVPVGTANQTVTCTKFQAEDITGRADQTTPSEYVSVGALDYRSEQDPLYLSLPGVGGSCTTPDSVANSVVGDLAIVVDFAPNTVSGGGEGEILSKMVAGAGQRSYQLNYSAGNGALLYYWSADGTAATSKTSSAAYTFATQRRYVAVTHDVDNGAAGNDVKFWTSSDGATWTQLGSTATTAGTTSIFNGTSALNFGGTGDADTAGKYYSGQVYNGIPPMLGGSGSATPVVDFNPQCDATTPTGTITSSTTGEVWTINGASSVVRNATYHGSFVDGIKCFPTDLSGNPIAASTLLGYVAEGARTNLCLQSQTLGTTWATDGSVNVTENQYIAPDGTATMDQITSIAVASQHYLKQGITFSAATTTYSCYLKYVNNQWTALVMSNGGGLLAASFDLLNGVAGALAAGTTSTIQPTEISGVYRVSITGTMSAGVGNIYISPNATNTASLENYTSAGTETVGAWGAQLELGSFASSYIATTTIAVTRNADVLTYSGGDIPNLKTLYARFSYPAVVDAATNYTIVSVDDGGLTTNSSTMRVTGDTLKFQTLTFSGSVLQSLQDHTNTINSASHKTALTWPANGIISVIDGGDAKTDASNAPPAGLTTLRIGLNSSGGQNLDGNIGPLYGWTRNLSQSELNAVTA